MFVWVLLAALVLPAGGGADCEITSNTVARISSERVIGSLARAEAEARRLLKCPELDAADRLAIQLELAKILDRSGLHNNTRPVVEAVEILKQAEAEIAADDTRSQARMALALAEYYYRAEMDDREFKVATEQAHRAMRLYSALGDVVGETDAVHRLGLIALQKRELEEARKLFDRSLELSASGGERPIFLSDYHRHVGFVDMLEGDQASAITHFEESLAYRNDAGSRDYGLFARTMLGSALIDGERAAEARPYLEEALQIARELPSPFGELRATYGLARMHEALRATSDAIRAYQATSELATELGVKSIQQAAQEAVRRLIEQKQSPNTLPN